MPARASSTAPATSPILGRVGDGREPQSGALDVGLILPLRRDQDLVPEADTRLTEGDERQEVAGAAACRQEDPHRLRRLGLEARWVADGVARR